jgi:hypothetical protein
MDFTENVFLWKNEKTNDDYYGYYTEPQETETDEGG